MPAIPCFSKEVCPPQPCRRHGCGDGQGVTYIRRGVSTVVCRYTYDSLGQLVREDNRYTGKSYTWKYDEAGNILNRKTYAYTIDALGTVQNTVIYGYDNGSWGDLLISFNGQSIAYDGIGNPGTWNGSALTWQGRRLMSYGSNTYTYNADGIRTSKTVNGVEHIYHLSGTQILDEEWIDGNTRHLMVYVYDASGQPIGISHYTYNGTIVSENYYLLVSNIQGDIIGIYDSNGTRVVTYVYDAWGRILSTTGTGANTIGVYNPFRYRGYYYDTETSLYYLNSRYYDPNVGRFLNADIYINANGDLIGFNMFAYCSNNPVNRIDFLGTSWISDKWNAFKERATKVISSFFASFEMDFGLGWGAGGELEDVGAEYYWDFYVGVDDGEWVAGNVVSCEAALGVVSLGNTYDHRSEQGGATHYCRVCGDYISAQSIMNCPNSKKSTSASWGVFSRNDEDISLGFSASAHLILGGHINIAFNLSEFYRRVFEK